MKKPAAKPYDPNAAMRRRLEAEDVEWFDRLTADPSIRIAADVADKITAIQRRSVFGVFLARKTISQDQHNAVDRLWTDLAIARHEADRSPLAAGSGEGGSFGPLDRALAAQDRCALVAAGMGQRAWLVMREQIKNEIEGAPQNWRDIVRTFTGETDLTAQAMVMRWVCAELVEAYKSIDNSPPVGRQRAILAGGV